MINEYLISEDNSKLGHDENANKYYYEKITKDTQCYSITWRGALPLGEINRFIKLLWDNGIKYESSDYMSKTRDDAGALKYYSRIQFWTDRNYYHDDKRKNIISWSKFCKLLKKDNSNGY